MNAGQIYNELTTTFHHFLSSQDRGMMVKTHGAGKSSHWFCNNCSTNEIFQRHPQRKRAQCTPDSTPTSPTLTMSLTPKSTSDYPDLQQWKYATSSVRVHVRLCHHLQVIEGEAVGGQPEPR